MTWSLTRHMFDALCINCSRAWYYARQSSYSSLGLSAKLIFLECCSMGISPYYDMQDRTLQKRGTPLIASSVMPMDVADKTRPPLYRSIASPELRSRVASIMESFQTQVLEDLETLNFSQIADHTYQTLQAIEIAEKEGLCHFAMSKHMLESIGFCALQAMKYSRDETEVLRLAKNFIHLQVSPITWSVDIDLQAQKVHSRGVGIILNDVPVIPFISNYRSLRQLS